MKKLRVISLIIAVCCIFISASSCENLEDETKDSEKTRVPTTPEEHVSANEKKCLTVPSGYLELTVSPSEIYSGTGEEIEINCSMYSLVNTPIETNSVELIVFDSNNSLLREQEMTMSSHWSARTSYTIAGDEAYYRLKVKFTTPYADPKEYLEYTDCSFPITADQGG
jgi:hypothetical protein